jgi:conjugal transfer pilus assembly protein TraL
MTDRYAIPRYLDAPELIGIWTLDEFVALVIPFVWGILNQQILLGIGLAVACWLGLRKAKAGRSPAWIIHLCYWYFPSSFAGLKATPPSHCRLMAG